MGNTHPLATRAVREPSILGDLIFRQTMTKPYSRYCRSSAVVCRAWSISIFSISFVSCALFGCSCRLQVSFVETTNFPTFVGQTMRNPSKSNIFMVEIPHCHTLFDPIHSNFCWQWTCRQLTRSRLELRDYVTLASMKEKEVQRSLLGDHILAVLAYIYTPYIYHISTIDPWDSVQHSVSYHSTLVVRMMMISPVSETAVSRRIGGAKLHETLRLMDSWMRKRWPHGALDSKGLNRFIPRLVAGQ